MTVIPINGKRHPMDDPSTRAEAYIAEAQRMARAGREATLQIPDPIEQSLARTKMIQFASEVIDLALPPEDGDGTLA